MTTFKDLNTLVAQRQAELADIASRANDTVYGAISPIWKGLLGGRPNFLEPRHFNAFRNASTSAIHGVGGHKEEDETARLFDQSVVDIANAQNIPDEVIAAIAEPVIGSPPVHPYRGNLFSSVFLSGIAVAWRIAQFAKQFGPMGRPLRVCEIGAGFGAGAQILHQLLDIESYTIIDLAENLYLSSIFLPSSLPGRTHQIVDPQRPESLGCGRQLNFSLPSFTDSLEARPFDLVINRASMGEMPLTTARAYISWIKGGLSPNGIFYFANRFNVAMAGGAARLSDFGLQHFDMRFLAPVERPTRPTNQIHTEIVVSAPTPALKIDAAHLDVIGDLVACGFDPQIRGVIQGVLGGTLSPELRQCMELLRAIFSPSPVQAKYQLLQNPILGALPEVKGALLAAAELIGGADADAARRKLEVLSPTLGVKLEARLRGLYAEREAVRGGTGWMETLEPLRASSASMHAMAKRYVAEGKAHFSAPFRRDLRVTA